MILDNWRTIEISELGDVVTGRTPPEANQDHFGLEYPFLTPSDIEADSYRVTPQRYLSQKGAEKHQKQKLPPKSTCVVCIGATIGKVCLTDRLSFSNQQINSVVPNEHHDAHYVYYLLRQQASSFTDFAGGAATPIINKSSFARVKVTVPPLPVQRKIAAVLSAYDDLIENNTRRIALLEKMAEEVYREWFVRLRFPRHEKVRMQQGILEGWTVKRLDGIAEFAYGKALRDENRVEGSYPVVGSSGVVGSHNNFLVKSPGIVIGRKGNVGSIHWLDEDFFPIDTVYYLESEISHRYM